MADSVTEQVAETGTEEEVAMTESVAEVAAKTIAEKAAESIPE